MAPKRPSAPKRKAPAAASAPAAATGAPAPAKKTCPTRTPQTPFEECEEALYSVDKIIGQRWLKGARQYLVRWDGYSAAHDTWEPMDNLVGCAAQIRDFEKQRETGDKAAAEAALAKRQQAKADAAAAEAGLRVQAAEQALAGTGEGGGSGQPAGETAGGVLKKHQSKTAAVWKAFDLTIDKPACKLMHGSKVCGIVPSASAGTQNYWAHLWAHHRSDWYELKRKDGKLNAAGEAELAALKEGLANLGSAGASQRHDHGGEFLSAKLPPAAKATMDRITAEWIVDEDEPFNAASTSGFR